MEKTTSGVAIAGLIMPAWEQHLEFAGAVATAIVPILSAGWLALQIVVYVRKQWRARS